MITELVMNERLEGQFICSEPFNNKAIRSALHKTERKGTFAGGNPERQSENRRKYEPTENTNKRQSSKSYIIQCIGAENSCKPGLKRAEVWSRSQVCSRYVEHKNLMLFLHV